MRDEELNNFQITTAYKQDTHHSTESFEKIKNAELSNHKHTYANGQGANPQMIHPVQPKSLLTSYMSGCLENTDTLKVFSGNTF